MRKMKRFFALLIVSLLLTGCKGVAPDSTEPPETTETKPKPQILSAWTGEFSKEKLEQAIKEYQQNYTPIVSDGENVSAVSFEPGFDIAEFTVSRLSKVDDRDINVEMSGYIDLYIDKKCDGKKITIATDWWYGLGSNTKAYPVWSYLVYVKDTAGELHYYYFRLQSSTPQNDAES